MSNARIQFSLASEDVWNAYNPFLKEGEIVTSVKANKKVKLIQGKIGGSNYSDSTLIWDQDNAESLTSRSETAATTAATKASSAASSASAAAASQAAAANSANSAADSASAASGYASTATAKATAAANSASAANNYAANAKNYSENVNVFLPSVSDSGVLSWTNKAGLANPASVNIKGAKGDKGDKGDKGATGAPGAAATIHIGNVVTGAPGTNVVVTNSGTSSAAVLNFQIPRGTPGADGGVTVDEVLNATSLNPIANKTVYAALQGKVTAEEIANTYAKKTDIHNITASIPTKVSDLENDAGYLTQHQSLDGYAKTSVVNIWTDQQNFHDLMLYREKYTTYVVNGTSDTPTTSTMLYTAVGAFTLNLSSISSKLATEEATVFTAYIKSGADYTLTIANAGTIKYIGSASDVAITSAGLLLNIMMLKDASGNLTSIVQASKLS